MLFNLSNLAIRQQPSLRNCIAAVCFEAERLIDPNKGEVAALSRRLDGMLRTAKLSEPLKPFLDSLYGANKFLDVELNQAEAVLFKESVIAKASVEDLNLKKGLTRLVEDIRNFSKKCEELEIRFFEIYKRAAMQQALINPAIEEFMKKVSAWIHYPNCSIGGGVAIAAGKMLSNFSFKRLVSFALEWHKSCANRIYLKPRLFRETLESQFI